MSKKTNNAGAAKVVGGGAAGRARPLTLDERLERMLRGLERVTRDLEALREIVVREHAESRALAAEQYARAEKDLERAEADRNRLARLEDEAKESRGHRRNLSRALEDLFAVSLPRAMLAAHQIEIRREDIRMRVRQDNRSREFDFIARNHRLALAGEVKTHLTRADVLDFCDALIHDFRRLFPEYDGLPVYGAVAGGLIDADAAELARQRGLIILRLEGAEVHPDTCAGFPLKAY